ncbi:Predicted ATPase [Pseudomonas sp. NFR09]|uniref:ATP-binding protein n=1 Tax=Pseudomonas sp. NFR09 TaxID=1566249 RepID=UPI0008D1280C|nr:winged helix-turn-helix domain-containing protein [Pseudomonas sp. NFR09]SET64387.1 Predicted ATPase [Pseudomonas sp. NFR09]
MNFNSPRPKQSAISFGPFVLIPQYYQLLKNGEPVPLGNRAMLLLIALATRPGELLEKAELLSLAWPKVVVEECNLRAQILTLRRALADDANSARIVTVSGRGYRFDAVTTSISLDEAPLSAPSAPLQHNACKVFGRDKLLNILCEQLETRRFVTLSGHAGAGKTTVAQALADRLHPFYPQGVIFIDLAPVSRGQLVHVVIAAALKIECDTDDPLSGIARRLAASRALLILDNCEHVLDEVATAVEAILCDAWQCSILVTSREPLRVQGECVHDLPPLPFPPETPDLTLEQAMKYPAIELLVERIAAHDLGYVLNERDVQSAAAICRKLEGNALAIELAAARVKAFGIGHLPDMLDGVFRLQMTGRRTAFPRHRTLGAALDWTYAMLSAQEQALLRQLSVFSGLFTLNAVEAVTKVQAGDRAQIMESLLDKSLIMSREELSIKRYRLLETTRLYAAQKLAEHGETGSLALRHADWILNELQNAVQDLVKQSPQAWLARYRADVDNVRAALEWAYSPDGDRELAVELTLVSAPLWLRLSLTAECYDWVSRGLQSFGDHAPVDEHQRMRLLTISASVMTLAYGSGNKIRQAWRQVGADARALGDTNSQLRALWGLWSVYCCGNQYLRALELADQYVELSKDSRCSERQLLGLRMRANTQFYMGRLDDAYRSVVEALSAPSSTKPDLIDLHFNQRIAACSIKSQIQLLQGDVDAALLALEQNVSQAINLNHPATLWYTLSLSAIPFTLLSGRLQKTRHCLSMLQESMEGHDLYLWRHIARAFEQILLIHQGAAEEALPSLGEVLEKLRDQGGSPLDSLFRCEYARGLALLGLTNRALEMVDETLKTAIGRQERWLIPKLFQIKAQILAQEGRGVLAYNVLRQAESEAISQGANFWLTCLSLDLEQLEKAENLVCPPQGTV